MDRTAPEKDWCASRANGPVETPRPLVEPSLPSEIMPQPWASHPPLCLQNQNTNQKDTKENKSKRKAWQNLSREGRKEVERTRVSMNHTYIPGIAARLKQLPLQPALSRAILTVASPAELQRCEFAHANEINCTTKVTRPPFHVHKHFMYTNTFSQEREGAWDECH